MGKECLYCGREMVGAETSQDICRKCRERIKNPGGAYK